MTDENKPSDVAEMSTAERTLRAFGPLGGGLLLDAVDLATFGVIGFYLGPILGGILGWWLSSVYGFGTLGQCMIIVLIVVYFTLPGTSVVPVATIVFALIRFADKKRVKQ